MEMEVAKVTARQAFERGEGILRLAPVWVPRAFCIPGKRIKLHPALDRSHVDVVIDKGQAPDTDGYSGFAATDLETVLREHGITQVTVVGLATDYCVKNTALDALRAGFQVTVDATAVRGVEVEAGDSERALAEVRAAGGVMA